MQLSDLELSREREYNYELQNIKGLDRSREHKLDPKARTVDLRNEIKKENECQRSKKSKSKKKFKNTILEKLRSKSKTPKFKKKSDKLASSKNKKKPTVPNSSGFSKRNS